MSSDDTSAANRQQPVAKRAKMFSYDVQRAPEYESTSAATGSSSATDGNVVAPKVSSVAEPLPQPGGLLPEYSVPLTESQMKEVFPDLLKKMDFSSVPDMMSKVCPYVICFCAVK